MSLLAVALKELISLGVSGDALVAAVERLDAAAEAERCATLAEAVEAAARRADAHLAPEDKEDRVRRLSSARKQRWRDARDQERAERSARGHSVDISVPSVDIPSPETKVSPTPPSKTQTLTTLSEPKGSSRDTTCARKGPPKSRASRRCPEPWSPSEADLAVGAALGFTPGDLERELSMIRDHEFQTARSDWSATYRNWLRTSAKRNPPKAHERPSAPTQKRLDREANMSRAFAGAQAAARMREFG